MRENQFRIVHTLIAKSRIIGRSVMLGSAFLPIPRTSLIGRQRELASAQALLLDESVPLLTLIGPGGVGKTRLALVAASKIAASFSDGVFWVDLSSLIDESLIPSEIAKSVGLTPSS